ncbi:MAG: FkbM family methyltransferase [Alphaproteobacteria bacterium]
MSAFAGRLLAGFQALPFEWGRGRRWCIRQLRRRGAFPVTTQVFGHAITLHDDNTSERKFLVQPRVYNRREWRFLVRRLPWDGGVFVDIGANAGLYAFAVAAHTGPHTRILCLEPNPLLTARIAANLRDVAGDATGRGRLIIDPRAVGDRNGRARLAVDRGLGAAGLTEDSTGLEVEVATLTTILDDHDVTAPDALKIDVEGFEDRALLPFFADAPPERWPRAMVVEHCNRANWRDDLAGELRRLGYVERGRTRNNLLLDRSR